MTGFVRNIQRCQKRVKGKVVLLVDYIAKGDGYLCDGMREDIVQGERISLVPTARNWMVGSKEADFMKVRRRPACFLVLDGGL